MKKYLVLILSVIAAFAAMISLTACEAKVDKDGNVTITDGDKSNDDSNGGSGGGSQGNQDGKGDETPKHSHTFNKQVATEPYLKSKATCTAKAVYYISCECGEKGEQTFEYGDKLPHTFDKQITVDKYLKSAASCTRKAVYYYSCECGLASEIKTFEYGEILPHEFNNAYICTNCSYKYKSDGLSFELSTDNNSYVCTGLGTFDGKILIIPSVYNGKPVTKIEEDAFKNATDITDVLIPDSITEVGFNAFGGCSNLTKMVLPFVGAYADGSGDENIGYIFGASSYGEHGQKLPSTLTTVVLSDTTTKVGDSAFAYCRSLTSITIGNGVTSIGGSAFYDCNALKAIILPNSVTSIGHFPRTGSAGDMAFMRCSSLENIYYGGSVDEWLQIEGLYDLMNYSSSYKKLYINGELLTEAVIDTATEIKSYAFYGCRSLTSVTIGDGVTSIERGAFSGCTSLTSITIGNGVTSIGSSAFSGCSSLTNVTIGDSVTSIDDYAFYGCSSFEFNKYDNGLYLGNGTNKYLVLVKPKTYGIKNITINDGCKTIIDEALRGCKSLKTINYKGSKVQWDAIGKGTSWNSYAGSYTINYNYVGN